MRSVSGGVLADGLATVGAGLFGTIGMNPYQQRRADRRHRGLEPAGRLGHRRHLRRARVPAQGRLVIALIPRPVIGAALVFTAAFILVNGIQIITSRMLDVRRALVIGVAFMAAVRRRLPAFFAGLPAGAAAVLQQRARLGTLWRWSSTPCSASACGGAQRLDLDPGASTPARSTTSWTRRVRRGEPGATSSTGPASTSRSRSRPSSTAARPRDRSRSRRASTSSTSTSGCRIRALPSSCRSTAEQRGDHGLGGRAAEARGIHAAAVRRSGPVLAPGGRSTILFHFDH